jgi:hypothetical protein
VSQVVCACLHGPMVACNSAPTLQHTAPRPHSRSTKQQSRMADGCHTKQHIFQTKHIFLVPTSDLSYSATELFEAYVTVCVCGKVAERWAGKLVFIAGNDAENAQLSDEQSVPPRGKIWDTSSAAHLQHRRCLPALRAAAAAPVPRCWPRPPWCSLASRLLQCL